MNRFFLVIGCFLWATNAFAQVDKGAFKPVIALQTWGVYTLGAQHYDEDLQAYKPVVDRPGFMIRRTRLGVTFRPNDQLKVRVVSAIDQVGHQPLDGTVGGTNNGSFPTIGLWDAWADWQVWKGSDKLHLIGGYYTPMVSRESVISAFDVTSMEKSFSQWYIRKQLTGKGPGRTTGLTVAGMVPSPNQSAVLKYGFGIHNPRVLQEEVSTVALFTGRLAGYFGDVEGLGFRMSDPVNDFSGRKLVTLGASGSWQSTGDGARKSWTAGGDFSLRYVGLLLEGEWHLLADANLDPNTPIEYNAQTGFLRLSLLQSFGEKYWLEPSVMWMFFRGGVEEKEQQYAAELNSFSGAENTFDAGVNCYLNQRKLKIYLHYTWRTGNPGTVGEGAMVNMYFVQSEVGAIKRGNWLGLGLNVVL